MPNDITVTKNTTVGSERWDVEYTADQAATVTKTMDTAGTMMDRNVKVSVTTPAGTEGTPTATKGAVSGNAISVTPSVTNSAGYISGGTRTGTAVSVAASELVSGTKAISASGTTDVTNYASASVAAGSATTPATTITANPSISVDSSTGVITATASATQSVTPTVSAGYVSSGTAGTITVSGSNTSSLTTQAAQTIHPSTSDQTIASGKYLTGAQTVKGVLLTNLTAGNIKDGVTVKVGDSTDDDCVTSVTGTYSGGGGGMTLLYEVETTVSTTSTTETLAATYTLTPQETGQGYDGFLIILTTLKGGFVANAHAGTMNIDVPAGTSHVYTGLITFKYVSDSSGTPYASANTYGVYGRISKVPGVNSELKIYTRYRAQTTHTGTINGTYVTQIYYLPFPTGHNPFDTT